MKIFFLDLSQKVEGRGVFNCPNYFLGEWCKKKFNFLLFFHIFEYKSKISIIRNPKNRYGGFSMCWIWIHHLFFLKNSFYFTNCKKTPFSKWFGLKNEEFMKNFVWEKSSAHWKNPISVFLAFKYWYILIYT